MSHSDSSSLNTAIIAGLAAALGGLLVLQWKKNEEHDRYRREQKRYPYEATFLQNQRTRVPSDDMDLVESTAKGWSMAEALAAAEKQSQKKAAMTPAEVLRSLQRGNSRFWSGTASRPEKSAFERRQLISQQFPATAVLGCADSRVPTEIIFDQGLGDMFVVRVAGNCLGHTTEGSLEYAVKYLQVKILLIMGHEGCGAIKSACLPMEKIEQEPVALADLLNWIKGGLDEKHLSQILDSRARDREAVVTNVKNQVMKLVDDPRIMARVDEGSLKIIGGFYEISSGIVDFFMQVSKDHGGEFKPSPGVQSRYNFATKKIVYA